MNYTQTYNKIKIQYNMYQNGEYDNDLDIDDIVSIDDFTILFDGLSVDDLVNIWNESFAINESERFKKTNSKEWYDLEDRSNFKDLDLLQQMMYPYFKVKSDKTLNYYNDIQVCEWIVDDIFTEMYEALKYIYEEKPISS